MAADPRWGIRAQLVTLVAGALLPLLALAAWLLYQQHEDTRRQIRGTVLDEAQQLRSSIDGHLQSIEGVLAALAPLAARERGNVPSAELETIVRHLPTFVRDVRIADREGRIVASRRNGGAAPAHSARDRGYFEAALASRRLVVSEPLLARSGGTRLVVAALAFRDAQGEPLGVIILSTDLAALEGRLFAKLSERRLASKIVTDAGAAVAVSEGLPEGVTSKLLRDSEGRAEVAGELAGGGAYAIVRAQRAPWSVVVTTDPEVAAHRWSPFYDLLAAAAIALVLGLGAAVWLSRRIARPLGALREGAEILGRGELWHRVPTLTGEAARVAEAFNSMAEQLEAQRITMRADAERFRAVFHNCPLPMAISDFATGRFLDVNAAFTAMSGKSANEVLGRSSAEVDLWNEPVKQEAALRELRERGRIEAFECRQRVQGGKEADLLLFAELVDIGNRPMIVSTTVDVTERKESERRIRDVTNRLTLATRSARIGIWDLDLRHGHLAWDETLFDLFGIQREDFSGRFEDWLRRVVLDDRAQVERFRTGSRRSDEFDIQYRVLRGDGNVRHMRSSATVERDVAGEALRLTGTTRDVTETVMGREALARVNSELEARVAERTAALQETVQELEAFSYTVAHDLRAPLRAIDGFSSCLAGALPADDSEASRLLAKVRRNVGSMDGLIDGLLSYARVGRQSFHAIPVDMTELAREVRAQVLESYPGVEVTIESLPPAHGDPAMLRQVWSNLIGNACKFSHGEEAPRVAVGATRDAEGPIYFVWDNGVGFDMRYRDRLFRVFERLHTDASFGGAGVGLAVVQRVVQRHAGMVWAEGFPGEGATFYFRLPEAVAVATA